MCLAALFLVTEPLGNGGEEYDDHHDDEDRNGHVHRSPSHRPLPQLYHRITANDLKSPAVAIHTTGSTGPEAGEDKQKGTGFIVPSIAYHASTIDTRKTHGIRVCSSTLRLLRFQRGDSADPNGIGQLSSSDR